MKDKDYKVIVKVKDEPQLESGKTNHDQARYMALNYVSRINKTIPNIKKHLKETTKDHWTNKKSVVTIKKYDE